MDLPTSFKQTTKKIVLPKIKTKFVSILLIIFSVFGAIGFLAFYLPGKELLAQIDITKSEVLKLKQSISDKDLIQIKNNLQNIRQQLKITTEKYKKFSYLKIIPKYNKIKRERNLENSY